MIKRQLKTLLFLAFAAVAWQGASAQHTLGFTAGYGMASSRLDPKQEMKAIWGSYTAGLTWRYYGQQLFVGGFGIDLEFLQQGFSLATNASMVEEKKDYRYYTRNVNSIVLPIVWQPHFYLFRNHVRVYLEAAATFSYHLSSTYENEGAKASRYYFGLSDIVRNRNKYADNGIDGSENPFWATPMRSPLDNLTVSVGLSYRFNKEGFSTWKPRPKREKNREVFKYGL